MSGKSYFILVIIAMCLLFTACNNTQSISIDKVADEDEMIAVIDDSIFLVEYEARLRNEYAIYRYNPNTTERINIGAVSNFVMTYGRPVQHNNSLYIFIASMVENQIQNNLYCIDLCENTLTKLFTSRDDYPLSPVSVTDDEVLFLGTNHTDEYSISSHVSKLDDSQKDTVRIIEKQFSVSNGGEILINFAAANNNIYILTMVNQDDKIVYVVDVYDEKYNHLSRLELDLEFGDLYTNQKITKFYVAGRFIFLRTTSNGFIGEIQNDKVMVRKADSRLDMAYKPCGSYENECVFYVMRTTELYALDLDSGEIKELPWEYNTEHVIKMVLANDNGYILQHYKEDEKGNATNTEIEFFEVNTP